MNNPDKAVENLERYYRSFVDQEKDWGFFLGLSDYVQHVQESKEASEAISQLLEQKTKDSEKLTQLEKQSLAEVKVAAKKLLSRIKEQNVAIEGLNDAVKNYSDHEEGRIAGDLSDAQMLFEALENIVCFLFQNGKRELVKDYILPNKKFQNSPGEQLFAKSMHLRNEEGRDFVEKRETAIWNAWDRMNFAHATLIQREKYGKELHKECCDNPGDTKKQWLLMNYMGYQSEIEKIKKDEGSRLFQKSEFKLHASRVHNHLMATLRNTQHKKSVQNISILPLPYDWQWEQLKIEICSNDSFRASYPGMKPERFTYVEFGLKDHRKGDLPTKLWEVLNQFADHHGMISLEESKKLYDLPHKLETHVQRLRKHLKTFFKKDDDPFYPYKAGECYRCRFQISDLRDKD